MTLRNKILTGKPLRPSGLRARRRLVIETLESRQPLAVDLGIDAFWATQDGNDPYDVDQDATTTATDALLIANYLNGEPVAAVALDVDGDGEVTEGDFSTVISHLNAALGYSPADELVFGDSGGLGTVAKTVAKAKTTYAYSVVGNPDDAKVTPKASGLALVGGGTDVDEVFRWMGAKANSGDFLVLRATGTNAYNRYIDNLVPSLDSVATLVIPDSVSAHDAFVAQKIREAEAIFLAGGDQADYVNFWKNTPVETAIYAAVARGAPIGGTSAGLAVLGDYDFSAEFGTISSSEALANPNDPRITLSGEFLNAREYRPPEVGTSPFALLTNVITDSHFQQRDRMGRLVTFVARMDADGLVSNGAGRAIGVNEQTALLVEPTGGAQVVGNPYNRKLAEADQQRAVYFLDATVGVNGPLAAPLSYSGVQIARASYDPKTGTRDLFDLASWVGLSAGVDSYTISASAEVLASTQPGGGAIY